jgi:hypothetical protein
MLVSFYQITRRNTVESHSGGDQVYLLTKQVACFKLVSCLNYSSILKMEAKCSSETPVDYQCTIWRDTPEARTLNNRIMGHK